MKNNFLIVGLGNPGNKYKFTRHNVGFLFLDYFFQVFELKKITCEYYKIGKRNFINKYKKKIEAYFMFPLTYMNNSGLAIKHFLEKNIDIKIRNIIVIHDDIDMKLGKIKLKTKGGHGGHNGIKSIIRELNSEDFFRIKIGIDRPINKKDIVKYVLSDFSPNQFSKIEEKFGQILNIIIGLFFEPVEKVYSYISN